jgi:hypothetical protein
MHERVGWTTSPNARGTFEIISSCIFTLSLCCWTAVHPDVGNPEWTSRRRFAERSYCFLLAIVVPEVVVFLAFTEWCIASDLTKSLKQLHVREGRWEAIHSFYCIMGGLRISRAEPGQGHIPYFAIFDLIASGQVNPKDMPSSRTIRNKSKQDTLIKILTLLQVGSFITRVVARAVDRLPITTLEFSTLAFLPGTICMIVFWWNKPYDIANPTTVIMRDPLYAPAQGYYSINYSGPNTIKTIKIATDDLKYTSTSQDITRIIRKESMIVMSRWSFITALFFIVYGGIHLAAWNFPFATSIERTLWHISSLIMTLLLPLSWGLTSAINKIWTLTQDAKCDGHGNPMVQIPQCVRHQEVGENKPKKHITIPVVQVVHGIAMLFYGAARIYILLEGLLALRSLPRQCYETVNWPEYLPFFS